VDGWVQEAVDLVLEERRRRDGRGPRAVSLLAASTLHAVALAVVVFGPAARAARQSPPEYVAVQIVPAQALGVPEPPPRREPPRPAAPPPAPEPEKPAPPEPEPEKPPREAMPPVEHPARERRPVRPAAAPAAAPSAEEPAPAARAGSPEGSATGLSTLGAAVAGLDNPDFTYGYYVEQMLALIRAQWVRPPLGGGIEAVLHFSIARDGRIADVRIVQSSGYSSFDLAALRALQSASPLPPLPQSYRQPSLGVTLIVR
jgi:protein TonB